MPLWTATHDDEGRPKWLVNDDNAPRETRLSLCTGVDTQGWTMPAGGSGNVGAQREVIACCGSLTT